MTRGNFGQTQRRRCHGNTHCVQYTRCWMRCLKSPSFRLEDLGSSREPLPLPEGPSWQGTEFSSAPGLLFRIQNPPLTSDGAGWNKEIWQKIVKYLRLCGLDIFSRVTQSHESNSTYHTARKEPVFTSRALGTSPTLLRSH